VERHAGRPCLRRRGVLHREVGLVARRGELAEAQLVQDLAGLGVAEWIVLRGLQVRERLERRARGQRLER